MKIRDLDFADTAVLHDHEVLGLPPLERQIAQASIHPILKTASYLTVATVFALAVYLVTQLFFGAHPSSGMELITSALHNPLFWSSLLVGLLAQVVDGALGMA